MMDVAAAWYHEAGYLHSIAAGAQFVLSARR